jgi:hypothetical protein
LMVNNPSSFVSGRIFQLVIGDTPKERQSPTVKNYHQKIQTKADGWISPREYPSVSFLIT